MEIRSVAADDVAMCAELGRVLLDAYTTLPGHVPGPDYEGELADVAGRAGLDDTAVLAAVDGGTAVGCVTYIASPLSPLAEHEEAEAAALRMLGVARAAQGRGVGGLLVRACIERARVEGRRALLLHTTTWMHGAHRLYERLGFTRDPARDWAPAPDIPLLGYRLDLSLPQPLTDRRDLPGGGEDVRARL